MKKEVLIAIIIGFALGLVITFGVWTANKALKQAAPKQEANEQVEETPTPTPKPALSLFISSPEDNSLTNKEEIKIEGKTNPQSIIVILGPEEEQIIEADESGNFATKTTLVGGSNEIEVLSYDGTGNEASQTLTVVYSTAEI